MHSGLSTMLTLPHTRYYPKLMPWIHYVPVRNDLTDLSQRIEYILDPANDAQLQAIASASTQFVMNMSWEKSAAELRAQLVRTFACAEEHVKRKAA